MIDPSPSRKLLHVARNVRWAQLSSGSVVGIERISTTGVRKRLEAVYSKLTVVKHTVLYTALFQHRGS